MKARTFWKTVVADRSDFLDRVVDLLKQSGIRYCVIGGQAVNAYAEPLVSLDLDIAVALEQVDQAEELMRENFHVERFPFSINVSAAGSDLRLQLHTDPPYAAFVERAVVREVLGVSLPVAGAADVLQGKVWAASDETRRPTKRSKDLLDIARLLETEPGLRDHVPAEILDKLPR